MFWIGWLGLIGWVSASNTSEVVYQLEINAALSEYYAIMGLSYTGTLIGFKLDRALTELEPPRGYSRFKPSTPKTYDLEAKSVRTELEAHSTGHTITMTWTVRELSPDRANVRVETQTDDPTISTIELEANVFEILDRDLTRVGSR